MRQSIRCAAFCVLSVLSYPLFASGVTFEDLARHLEFSEVKLSPDGRHIAATTVVKDKPLLALLDLDTKKGAMVTPREGNQIIHFWWAGDNRVIYTEGTKVSGWDRPFSTGEIFATNADGTNPKLLFGYHAGTRAHGEVVSTLRNDPRHILISVSPWDTGAEGAFSDLNLLDVNDGSMRPVGKAPLRSAIFAADNHGVARFAEGYDSHAYPVVYYREGEGKPWTLLFQGTTERSVPWAMDFNRDDSKVYMSCQAAGKVEALCLWDVATQTMGEPVWSSATVEMRRLIYSLDGMDAVGVYSDPGAPTAEAFVAGSDAMKVIGLLSRSMPGESIRIVSSSRDGSKAIVLAFSSMDPGTFYLWDNTTGKATALLQRASWIKPSQMAAMQPIEFKARDGLTIHGYLSMPPGKEEAKHLPLVMFIHGGPFGIRDYWEYDPTVQALATHGYAVLQVNYRGSGGYGDRFMHAGYNEWGGKMQDDVTDATQWAIEQGITSPGHVCIFGGSYGGYAALEGVMKEPDLYRCAIGYVGVYDLPLMLSRGDGSESTVARNFWRSRLGNDAQDLAARSPVNQTERLKASVMLIAGGKDERVPPVHADHMRAALDKRGVAYEWLYKPDEGHGFYDEKNNAELFQRVTQFLDRHIGTGGSVAAGSP
ncbi:S9 family peptidase [Dyella japonica]|uniref:Prolyl oligopeptidase n=1 Tax=Dyella japonica A8 TaxID=1217721 RepID=A0A075K0X8_9GAMM|nr:S9 family peptidase [Dyella japonica]AIF47412.1 prolyl oligopeptidase [Dyella japonica A8]